MLDILIKSGIQLTNGKIAIPNHCNRAAIDVGLGNGANQSQRWLIEDENLFVIGFEPVSENIESIVSGQFLNSKTQTALDPKYINDRFILIKCALSSKINAKGQEIYVTRWPTFGNSSLLFPKHFSVEHIEVVPVWTLEYFLENYFPFEKISMIEHLKSDTQGSDFEVIKGAGTYISKIAAITVELDNYAYHDTSNSLKRVTSYLKKFGFFEYCESKGKKSMNLNMFLLKLLKIKLSVDTKDPVYLNKHLLKNFKQDTLKVHVV